MAEHAVHEVEEKELVNRNRFLELLRNWQIALENNQDFDVIVNGQRYTVPADAAERARFRVEYEIDQGEYELELTMKWR